MPNPDAMRQSRGEQLRKARAAAQRLRKVFPSIEQLRIELSFKDAGSSTPADQAHVLYPSAPAFFTYRCPNWNCDGEFELDSAAHRAMRPAHRTEVGSLECRGSRFSEGGSKRPCDLRLNYAITAVRDEVS